MTNQTDNHASNWRDLADQLTPRQFEKLASMELHSQMPAGETADALLEGARGWAAANLAGHVMFAHIDAPPDSTDTYIEDIGDGVWVRTFDGTDRLVPDMRTADAAAAGQPQPVGDVTVSINGYQFADRRIERSIGIQARDDYDAPSTRRIAAALLEAADELDRLK